MSRIVAIQMDPIESIDIKGDSTFVMGLEAQARGYELLHYHPDDMFYDRGRIKAEVRPMTLRYEHGNHHDLGAPRVIDLARETDVILMRQDPPFDMNYITATHLLEAIHPETFVVNHPGHVRNAPEKIFVTEFPDLMPPTLITRSGARIKDFREEYKDIIVKPLFGNGGAGVFHL
ncbi:MAG TPA: glutathione synthase, partial [Thalassospira sp.]|nr:glutathione synthase [Thalassospira sp.]